MRLSEEELVILENDTFMPLKARVCEKVEQELAALHVDLKKILDAFDFGKFPEIKQSRGKLSKGENYHDYAYRVLDYPSILTREDMFLFRIMMLWGDAFSFHFILSGRYMEEFLPTLKKKRGHAPHGLQLARHEDPWTWHRSAAGWTDWKNSPGEELDEIIRQRNFFKLTYFLPLKSYNSLGEEAKAWMKNMLALLT